MRYQLIYYLLKRLFLIDNNQVKNGIRPTVIGRNNFMFRIT
ncbi:MAG: hypothetical protein IPP27_02245 [Bacteroidetes bacterium]|nr:hypothetical protein [Bacteroidota bacterium]